MAHTIFADSIPKVKNRGAFIVLTFEFEGAETHLVLTRHASVASEEALRRAHDKPSGAEIIQLGA